MDKAKKILDELIARYPDISSCREDVWNAFLLLNKCFSDGHKLLACGNGGSSADADHMVGELMKKFKKAQRPLWFHQGSRENRPNARFFFVADLRTTFAGDFFVAPGLAINGLLQ